MNTQTITLILAMPSVVALISHGAQREETHRISFGARLEFSVLSWIPRPARTCGVRRQPASITISEHQWCSPFTAPADGTVPAALWSAAAAYLHGISAHPWRASFAALADGTEPAAALAECVLSS